MPLPLKKFYIMRHGQSDANLKRIFAGGGMDSPLTTLGEEQAKRMADVVSDLSINGIFSSPLQRAHRTAEIVNTKKFIINFNDDLKEHHCGDWEGASVDEYGDRWFFGETPPNGESRGDFTSRVAKGLRKVMADHENPLIVAHGGVVRAIVHLYGHEIGKIHNCELLCFDPKPDGVFPWAVARTFWDEERMQLVTISANVIKESN